MPYHFNDLTVSEIIEIPSGEVPKAVIHGSSIKMDIDYCGNLFSLSPQDKLSIVISQEEVKDIRSSYSMFGYVYELTPALCKISFGGLLCNIHSTNKSKFPFDSSLLHQEVYIMITKH